VFNATFSNISAISWRGMLIQEIKLKQKDYPCKTGTTKSNTNKDNKILEA